MVHIESSIVVDQEQIAIEDERTKARIKREVRQNRSERLHRVSREAEKKAKVEECTSRGGVT